MQGLVILAIIGTEKLIVTEVDGLMDGMMDGLMGRQKFDLLYHTMLYYRDLYPQTDTFR